MKGIKNYTWHTKRFFFRMLSVIFTDAGPNTTILISPWKGLDEGKRQAQTRAQGSILFLFLFLCLCSYLCCSKLKQNTSVYIGRISEFSCASVSDSLRNLSYEKALREFPFHAKQRHIYTIGFPLRLALIQRLKGTRKWPIISSKLDNLSVDKRLIRKRKLCHEVIAKGIWQLL